MNDIIKNIEAAQLKAEVPQFSVGDTVKVYGKIKEGNRERIQVFEGIVIKKQGGSVRATFTVRKNSNGIGVEKTWPLHSPSVEKVEVIRHGKVRRAKLNYFKRPRRKERKGKRACKIMDRSGTSTLCILSLFTFYRKGEPDERKKTCEAFDYKEYSALDVSDSCCDSVCICARLLFWTVPDKYRTVDGCDTFRRGYCPAEHTYLSGGFAETGRCDRI